MNMNEELLREYLCLGDTLSRYPAASYGDDRAGSHAAGLPEVALLNSNDREKLQQIICIDGKTMRANKRKRIKPNHIVSAWCKEDGVCLGQRATQEKSNEITAIPELLNKLAIKDQVVTIDAMGAQTEIAKKIRSQRVEYVLALKGNQSSLCEDVRLFFEDSDILKETKEQGGYLLSKAEKAYGQIERREYY